MNSHGNSAELAAVTGFLGPDEQAAPRGLELRARYGAGAQHAATRNLR